MQKIKNKTMAIMIATLLILSMSGALMTDLPTTSAHTPPYLFTPKAYCFATPTPCGVGQSAEIFGFLNYLISGTLITNNIRFENYAFTVTAPDGTVQTFNFPVVSDSTSAQAFAYTPTMAGVYNISFIFPGQVYDFGGAYNGDYYAPANATYQWTVQQEPVSTLPQNPFPTEYWARPLNLSLIHISE